MAGKVFFSVTMVTRRTAGKACGNDALQRSSSTQRTRAPGRGGGVTGGGVGEVLVGHAEAAAEQRRGDRVGPLNAAWYPEAGRALASGGSAIVRRTGLATPSSIAVTSAGASPWARSRRAASTP